MDPEILAKNVHEDRDCITSAAREAECILIVNGLEREFRTLTASFDQYKHMVDEKWELWNNAFHETQDAIFDVISTHPDATKDELAMYLHDDKACMFRALTENELYLEAWQLQSTMEAIQRDLSVVNEKMKIAKQDLENAKDATKQAFARALSK